MDRSFRNSFAAATLVWTGTALCSQPRPAVIELFTSEGCSSCPPAEAYLGELASRPDVLALAYHVDYWDELGWKDRFGLDASVQRQRAYAKSLRLAYIYTPQIVLDGTRDFVGSDRKSVGDSLRRRTDGVPVALSLHGDAIQIDFIADSGALQSDIVLIGFQRAAVSPVSRGENAGQTLKEFNIVRSVGTLGQWHGAQQQFRVPRDSLPNEVTDVAILVQQLGQGHIIGAAAMPLR